MRTRGWRKLIVRCPSSSFGLRLTIIPAALQLAEHVTNLYVHEIALHHNQSPANFQPPFPSETFTSGVGKKETIGPAHISALGECLSATHGILNTILGIPLDVLVTLPVIFCGFIPPRDCMANLAQVSEQYMQLSAS
jgi:hypothetical protein